MLLWLRFELFVLFVVNWFSSDGLRLLCWFWLFVRGGFVFVVLFVVFVPCFELDALSGVYIIVNSVADSKYVVFIWLFDTCYVWFVILAVCLGCCFKRYLVCCLFVLLFALVNVFWIWVGCYWFVRCLTMLDDFVYMVCYAGLLLVFDFDVCVFLVFNCDLLVYYWVVVMLSGCVVLWLMFVLLIMFILIVAYLGSFIWDFGLWFKCLIALFIWFFCIEICLGVGRLFGLDFSCLLFILLLVVSLLFVVLCAWLLVGLVIYGVLLILVLLYLDWIDWLFVGVCDCGWLFCSFDCLLV